MISPFMQMRRFYLVYFVGIGISEFRHNCAVIDELGDVVTPLRSLTISRRYIPQ